MTKVDNVPHPAALGAGVRPSRQSVRQSRLSVTSISQAVAQSRETNTMRPMESVTNRGTKMKKIKLFRPLRRTFSTEFFLRAKQWRDVADFERKELLKVRIIRSLRQVSDGLLAISIVTVILSISDIELGYHQRGNLERPTQPATWGAPCSYSWNTTDTGGYGFRDNSGLKDFLGIIQFTVRMVISVMTLFTLLLVYWYSELERRLLVVQNHLSDKIGLFSSPLAIGLYLEFIICLFHLPPGFEYIVPEFQLVTFVRLYNMIKYMREHHPMRYDRMTEILKSLASTQLSSNFLLKSYFSKNPMSILIGLYMWNVFFVSYVVYSIERVAGTCMLYSDVIWMTAVTITNLGYGEFTPSAFISRIIISILSVFGIIQTALIVQVVQNYLKIPSDEQRILNFIERTRLLQLRQQAAARLIQCAWRRYKYGRIGIKDEEDYDDLRESAIASPMARYRNTRTSRSHSRRRSSAAIGRQSRRLSTMANPKSMCYGATSSKDYQEALWNFREISSQAQHAEHSKEFQVDDTAITSEFISRKLDQIEKIVRKGQTFGGDPNAARTKWLTAGRGTLSGKKKAEAEVGHPRNGGQTANDELLASIQALANDRAELHNQLRNIRKSIAHIGHDDGRRRKSRIVEHEKEDATASDESSDSRDGLNLFRRDPDEHNPDRRGGYMAL